jgi:hypothetical protein
VAVLFVAASGLSAQGVTTGAINGIVTDTAGNPLADAIVEAVHLPSGTRYRATSLSGGAFTLPNMRIGGPYLVTVSRIGFEPGRQEDVQISLAQTLRLDFRLAPQPLTLAGLEVTAEEDEVLNADRTGAATFISREQVTALPSIKRSTRDLTRLDPRSDGNFSFAGRNWLYNNVSVDGSYFNNPFGLDDPAPGGQTASEPIPYDAVEQVQVSVAPYDVRQSGFTGANINTVTRSGTNELRGSVYTFFRSEALLGNKVEGQSVIADPSLSFNQTGFSLGGPLMRDKLFFFINGEFERRDDPGTNFVASTGGSPVFGESRVEAQIMDSIRNRMISAYNYDPGAYEGFVHQTNNDKLLLKLDWNVNESHNLSLRYNYLNALRDLPPHPFVLSFANTGRGPNESSLPFQNSGYTINNELNSFALELNSRGSGRFANRFFASYNRFRDFREAFSDPFPTIEIGDAGVTYTTVGHEPFSINNILDQDVWQFQNNLSYFTGNHALTFGANFELFSFFNSFNIFRHGVFFLDGSIPIGSTFSSLDDFFTATDPANPSQKDFRAMIGSGPFKGELIKVGQLGLYVQDEFLATPQFNLTLGLRVDFPMYLTDPVDNPYSRGLTALDADGNPETVDQSSFPSAKPLFSPRVGFNWDASGTRSTQIRGGSGVFTGRVPFVWVGNVLSNPGANPNIFPDAPEVPTRKDAILQQSFDLNAMDPSFKWPQVWTTNVAIDQRLPWDMLGTLEFMYGKDLNSVFMRNADVDVRNPGTNPIDGRPIYSGELNPDGAGIYVIDNTSDGWHANITAQLRKFFNFGLNATLAYSYTEAKNQIQSTEIASVLWQNQPVQGNPNRPILSPSQFGQRHRIIGSATYSWRWSERFPTHFGVFFQAAEGNTFTTQRQGGNRYSYIYSGDVNGDGQGANDLIYIPRNVGESGLVPIRDPVTGNVVVTVDEQWNAFSAFIEQDSYLSSRRGQIAERGGGVNPWYHNVDLRILQDFAFGAPGRQHTFQASIDILNFTNLLSSSWGVRKAATPLATNPLSVVGTNPDGSPQLNYNPCVGGCRAITTFVPDPSLDSRWQMQIGIRYLFN